MKYLKIIGLAAVAAMALMAVGAGSASATEYYSTGCTGTANTCPAGTEIKASLATGTTALLTNTAGETINTCTGSTITGKNSNAGSATETVKGTVAATALTWSGCIAPVSTVEGGELETHWIAGTTNGTSTAKGFKVNVGFGLLTCAYTAGTGTHMGTLTGSEAGRATMDVSAIVTTTTAGCPSTAIWKATYQITSVNANTAGSLWVEEK